MTTTIIAVRAARSRGALPARLLAGYCLPGLGGRLARRCARRSASRTARRRRGATRSPSTTAPTRRARRRCSRCSPRAGPRDLLPRRRAGRAQPGARRARSSRPGHAIGLHCDRHRNLLRLAPRQVREDIARARGRDRASDRARDRALPPALRHPQRRRAAPRPPRGWRTLLWSHWGRDWEARATPESIARAVPGAPGPGSVLLLHDADDYSAPGSWRRTVAALPRVLETLRERSLEPSARSAWRGVSGPRRHRSGRITSGLVDRRSDRSERRAPAAARRRCGGAHASPRAAAGGGRC